MDFYVNTNVILTNRITDEIFDKHEKKLCRYQDFGFDFPTDMY